LDFLKKIEMAWFFLKKVLKWLGFFKKSIEMTWSFE